MESAVPEGDVIARVEVLGIINPTAATMGTMIKVTLFPGTPPFSYIP